MHFERSPALCVALRPTDTHHRPSTPLPTFLGADSFMEKTSSEQVNKHIRKMIPDAAEDREEIKQGNVVEGE